MNFEEAMHLARKGHKVTTAGGKVNGKPFFVVFYGEIGYMRVTMSRLGAMREDFSPSVYEKMAPWVIYKKDPFASIKNAIKRVSGKLQLNFSSNPS